MLSHVTKLSGYTGLVDGLLRQGIKNSSVVLDRLHQAGFDGGTTIVKDYIAAHKHLLPAKRQQVAPQGNRGRRYTTAPGEVYQMDWGFTDVLDYNGNTYCAACFAMICHHCGQRYIEFFPNARQENLFIGMINALFQYMGIPSCPDWQHEKCGTAPRSGGKAGLVEGLRGLYEGSRL